MIKERSEFKFTLGRKIDIYYPTNRYLLVSMIFIASITSILSGSLKQSLFTAVGYFFTWAITREIDPLKEYAAFVSALVTLLFFFFYDGISLAPLFFILLSLRFISGICGYRPTYLDIFSVFSFAGFLTYSGENSIYLIILSLMFLISWFRYSKNKVFFGGFAASLLATILVFNMYPVNLTTIPSAFNPMTFYLFLGMFIVASLFLGSSINRDRGIKDDLGGDLESSAIVKSLIYYSIVVILLVLSGVLSLSTQFILSVTLIGPLIWRLLKLK